MKKVPEIRFAEYVDDWEQRKLGDIFVEYSEKNHEELPALTIIQGGGTILREESDRALQYDKNSLSGYKMVKKDDFIVHLRSFEGGLEKANSDGIISPAYHTFHGDDTDSGFYYSFFRSRRFIDVLLKPHVYGIRDGRSIDIEGMKSIMIPAPCYDEQKAIGEYIETIDNLITLHQRKLEKLMQFKSSMLEKMFPQNGESVPEIRFAGFTGAWEQRKLGDYVIITSGEAPSKFEMGNELYIKVDDLNYTTKYIVESQNKVAIHKSIGKVSKGSIVFPKRGAAIMTNKVRILAVDCYMDTNMMALTSTEIDSEFLYNVILNEGLYKIADTSTIPQINNKHIEPYEVMLPEFDEQRMIGEYFAKLDNLITHHQRKLEKLKQFKSGLLDKMFI